MSSHHSATAIPRIDLWLAATMDAGTDPTVRRFLARAGVELELLAPVRRLAAAAGITERSLSSPAQIVEVFGPPVIARADRLVYDSVLWPEHQFIWAVSRWGDAGPLGFRLRETLTVAPMRADHGVEKLRAFFRPWHHTEHEVRCALGPADRTVGRPHFARWLYKVRASPVRVQLTFRWGLLVDISGRVSARMLPRGPGSVLVPGP